MYLHLVSLGMCEEGYIRDDAGAAYRLAREAERHHMRR
jgi:hypothetical protein